MRSNHCSTSNKQQFRIVTIRLMLGMILFGLSLSIHNPSALYAQSGVGISGNVYEDLDELTDNQVDGAGIGKVSNVQLYVTLLDSSGIVVQSVPVAPDGTYTLPDVDPGGYTLQLGIYDETFKIGSPPSIGASLPPNWYNTGENLGAGLGSDGTVNGLISVTMGASDIADANFGVKQLDTDGDGIPDTVDTDYNGNGILDVDEGICYDVEFGGDGTYPISTLIQRTWFMHSGKTEFADDNNFNITRIVNNPGPDVSNLIPNNVTVTYWPGPQSYLVTDVSSTTLEEAKANGEYIEVTFTTDSSYAYAYIDWVGFLNRADTGPGFSITYSISSDGGNNFTDLETFVEATDAGGGTYPAGRRDRRVASYPVAHGTTYTVRYYFYAIEGGATAEIEFDDPYVAFDVCRLDLRGNVYHDANGLEDGNVDGTGLSNPDGAQLYAVLVNTSGNVVASVPVNADGSYLFTNVEAGNYAVNLSASDQSANVGSPYSGAPLPAGWENTGEDCCDTIGDDGTVDGIVTSVSVGNPTEAQIAAGDYYGTPEEVNFGIQQLPVANNVSEPSQLNPGGTTQVQVPALNVSDLEDGTPTTIVIDTLPTSGTLYYDGVPVTAGQQIDNFDPTKLTVDPDDGAVTVEFTYSVIDSAGAQSGPATVDMPFSGLNINGTVFKDDDGNANINGTGIGSPGGSQIYATLVDSGGNVAASVPVNADGTYSFSDVTPGNYTVRLGISDESTNVGSPAGTSSLPGGWFNIGEDCCDNTGNDGTVDSSVSITLETADITSVNFGINDAPLAVSISYVASTQSGDQVTFIWQTATEVGNAGFNIQSETSDGLAQLNEEMIASLVIDSLELTEYSAALQASVTVFYIDEVGVNGAVKRNGPYRIGESYGVDSGDIDAQIFLPMIQR